MDRPDKVVQNRIRSYLLELAQTWSMWALLISQTSRPTSTSRASKPRSRSQGQRKMQRPQRNSKKRSHRRRSRVKRSYWIKHLLINKTWNRQLGSSRSNRYKSKSSSATSRVPSSDVHAAPLVTEKEREVEIEAIIIRLTSKAPECQGTRETLEIPTMQWGLRIAANPDQLNGSLPACEGKTTIFRRR